MSYSTYGTNILPAEPVKLVRIASVAFAGDTLLLHLSDGRTVQLDMHQYTWLRWLLQATPVQRNDWEIVPSGGGAWWPELDDGIELQPLLDMHSLT
ncbi:MAG: DUF2442 domain-containing protein [Caldilineaceae bacterium]